MILVYEDKKRRVIKGQEKINFSSFSSFHLVVITAGAKSKKQISSSATDDEDLIVKIDGKPFPKLNTKRLKDSPAAFSGGQLHNLSKAVYYLSFLKGKDHTIILEADDPPEAASFENLEVYTLTSEKKTTLNVEKQAEDGDGRPWLTFALDNLSLKSITPTITYSRRKRDSDDVKIIIDGKTQGNILREIKHFLWRYVGSFLPPFSSKTETETFTVNFSQGLHYIEFHADRMPTLHTLNIDFGIQPQPPIRIPTVENPKWTEDFYDDTPELLLARLLLGEAEDQSKETKTWVAGAILNRVKAKAWPNTIHGVILQPDQYDPFKPTDLNFPKITDPLKDTSEKRKKIWKECYEIAAGFLSGNIANPTEATHFHGRGVTKDWFLENIVPNGRFIRQIGDTYFYWSPN